MRCDDLSGSRATRLAPSESSKPSPRICAMQHANNGRKIFRMSGGRYVEGCTKRFLKPVLMVARCCACDSATRSGGRCLLCSRCLDDDVPSILSYGLSQLMHLPHIVITFSSITTLLLQNVLKEGIRVCTSWATASARAKTCGGSRQARRIGTKENTTHSIRRIHTCLPYTSLETTSCTDSQEPQHTGLYHQPQEQALPDRIKALDGLSSIAAAAFRKNIQIHTTGHRTFQLHPVSH
jgi:hypothetical protein